MKNINAIDKIIKELSIKDYLAMNPRKADGRPKYKNIILILYQMIH